MKRIWVVLAMVMACKQGTPEPGKGSAVVPVVKKPHVAGALAPIVTKSVTFFAPKDVPWWGEMSYACYAAAIRLQPGTAPSAAITQVSPLIEPSLRAADIDLDRDVTAIGAFGCGDGFCLYSALELRHPEKLPAMLSTMLPGAKQTVVDKLHYTVEAPGPKGTRTVHFQAVPLSWDDPVPTDPWAKDAAHATHVLIVSGLFGDDKPLDPLALADGGAARVKDVEAVVPDAGGMCMRGRVGAREFQPGYKLDHARFAMALPDGASDPLMKLVGSTRTMDVEVELALDPAPTEAVTEKWIAEARTWLASTMEPVRASLGASGPMADALFDVAALVGTKGFTHAIKGNALALSWRTSRISSSDLSAIETKLAHFLPASP